MRLGAIEAGGTKFVCGIADENGNILERVSFPTETPEITLQKVYDFFNNKGVEAIGVGSFGPIDPNLNSETYGYITKTPKKYWSDFNLIGELQKNLNVPMAFDTDVNGAALGEATWGAAKGLENCLYLTIGTGIGGGALVSGKLVHGMLHPEMGHIFVRRHPEDTYKGKCPFHNDCLEGLAAGPAIEERWGVKAYDLPIDHKAWELEAYYIAQALVNYILTLSPEKIVLGGGVMKQTQLFPLIRKNVKELLNNYVQTKEILEDLDNYIVSPGLGDNAGLLGSIALALNI
ncbi:ROK family protein [Candidatus Cetobacterium colombiensis]|jgi:fructokinase|uniref:fructokinase n=1 Tax=Candidatus Cetobacterium colombiensis TaxID=3073100 RepID=A0ABU4W9F4_9FUSO|nr:ROK family protein [Candidatus Cetobacterium colombiensis]MDX8336164.1 ROK family protein [Candidatus Cetobacterium colombiensis]